MFPSGFGSLLFGGSVICFLAWFAHFVSSSIAIHIDIYMYDRRPLGDPNPQASNLALAVVLLVVIVIQAFFNAWQGMIRMFSGYAVQY